MTVVEFKKSLYCLPVVSRISWGFLSFKLQQEVLHFHLQLICSLTKKSCSFALLELNQDASMKLTSTFCSSRSCNFQNLLKSSMHQTLLPLKMQQAFRINCFFHESAQNCWEQRMLRIRRLLPATRKLIRDKSNLLQRFAFFSVLVSTMERTDDRKKRFYRSVGLSRGQSSGNSFPLSAAYKVLSFPLSYTARFNYRWPILVAVHNGWEKFFLLESQKVKSKNLCNDI